MDSKLRTAVLMAALLAPGGAPLVSPPRAKRKPGGLDARSRAELKRQRRRMRNLETVARGGMQGTNSNKKGE